MCSGLEEKEQSGGGGEGSKFIGKGVKCCGGLK
jgi:hypothetical protein